MKISVSCGCEFLLTRKYHSGFPDFCNIGNSISPVNFCANHDSQLNEEMRVDFRKMQDEEMNRFEDLLNKRDEKKSKKNKV